MQLEDKVTDDLRQRMIAEAAYFRAERRNFAAGDPVRDWCEAEVEIDARLGRIEGARCVVRIEEALKAAGNRLASVRRTAARLSASARAEWQRDADELAALRDALKPKLAELRKEGERAGHKLRQQAERIGDEIMDLVRSLEAKAKH